MNSVAEFHPRQSAQGIMRSQVARSLYAAPSHPARTDFERSSCPTCKAPRLERVQSAPSLSLAGEPSLSKRVRAWWKDTEEARAVLLFLGLLVMIGLCLWTWLQFVVFES